MGAPERLANLPGRPWCKGGTAHLSRSSTRYWADWPVAFPDSGAAQYGCDTFCAVVNRGSCFSRLSRLIGHQFEMAGGDQQMCQAFRVIAADVGSKGGQARITGGGQGFDQ